MRDFPELNRLIAGNESSDQEILLALLETLDDYNNTPPRLTPVLLTSFPSPALLVRGAVANLMESVVLSQTRNQLTYSDDEGTMVSASEKGPQMSQQIMIYKNEYETKKTKLKIALNISQAYGGSSGVSSEYKYLSGIWED